MNRRALTTLPLAAVLTALALLLGACAEPPPPPQLTRPADRIERDAGLVIDGETIADAETYEAARSEGSFTLYSAYSANSEEAVIEQFTEDTGIGVDLVRLTANRMFERISAEHGAGRLQADVVRISDPGFVGDLNEQGVFQPYRPPTATHLLPDVEFDDGRYYRTFNPVYTFGYNTALVDEDEAPRSWRDLTTDRWRGRLGIAQVGAGGSALALTRFQRDELGDEFLRAYAGNDVRIFDSIGAELDGLARGEVSVGTVAVSGTNVARASNAPIRFVVPEEGFAIYDFYTGMAESARNEAAASVFLNWSLSRRGQEVMTDLGEYAVRSDLPPPTVMGVTLPELDSPLVFRARPAEAREAASDDQAVWNDLFGYNE
ncbi:ABC transporter substrate-binding protein [Streptomyces sp. NBC_01803]|uniref:ABC transporter substrate-binding protein n=1 Tax=Streptomyces sp. NBC_01803 TaxID=2975946 RepID=UPI002DDA1B47|nr:extracellular solute-binding protein [Streptomyces sp. NBC_01803]WSA42770.1 extracellular solute-binding protein [Streptomyces sp. NBC_01803]